LICKNRNGFKLIFTLLRSEKMRGGEFSGTMGFGTPAPSSSSRSSCRLALGLGVRRAGLPSPLAPAQEHRDAGRITESQNSWGWKGPLWVI